MLELRHLSLSSLLLSSLLLLPLACDLGPEDTPPGDGPPGAAGKADQPDACDEDGSYGDGTCDAHCPAPDPDCDDEQGRPACGGPMQWACEQADQHYCKLGPDQACGTWGDELGHCTFIPDVCDDLPDPVCGCDGHSYANECEAERQQVDILHAGICEPPPGQSRACGGWLGDPCQSHQFCRYDELASCGELDHPGTCTDIPPASTCPPFADPVCSCGGTTFTNACLASAAQASVRHRGPC